MGLSQYVYAVDPKDIIDRTDFYDQHGVNTQCEFYYWQKEYGLQDWMANLWLEAKNDPKLSRGDFVFHYIQIREEDLNRFEFDLNAGKIEISHKEFYDCYMSMMREFIKEAREILNSGYAIYYCSD